ncbi:MAG TPA: type II toxin-antitoxin system VapC family toxin [Stellaceae bacterium]|nr:type II toxin-antitoxin system VapC family toxin [Stellaceae bacterium]
MIVLDTNVISEVSRPRPSARVLDWMRSEPLTALFTTAITEGELRYGLALMAEGRRQRELEAVITAILDEDLGGRILPFDSSAAREFAGIAAMRRHAGKPISEPDARIAAITRSRGAALATRNTADFADCGLTIINPWL